MNKIHSQYVDPDSLQGGKYDNYRNLTYPDNMETQQSENNQYNKTKKTSININHQLEIKTSKPVLYPPPKVDTIQMPLNENSVDELAFNSENEKMDKKEVVSNLMKEFSNMLDDTSSIHERSTPIQEGKFENETYSDENSSVHHHPKRGNSEMLFDEFHSMLDESNDLIESNDHFISEEEDMKSLNEKYDTIEDKFFAMLSESDELLEEKQDSDTNEEEFEALEENNEAIKEEFITMLLESCEMQEEKQESDTNEEEIEALEENNEAIKENFITMLLESCEMQEEKQDSDTNEEDIEEVNENKDTIEDKFMTMLSVSSELQEEKQESDTNEEIEKLNGNKNTIEDKFMTMLSENDEMQEEKQESDTKEENEEVNQNNDTFEEKFMTMLSESSDLQEEKQESLLKNLKETNSKDMEDSSTDELHKKTSFKRGKKKKYCINKNKTNGLACLKENDFQKKTHVIDLIEKKKTTTVKMQVLLARLETDVDIVETIDLVMPLDNILRVEWSIQSLDCKVVLPSKTVFLKGEFIAAIEFSNKELENKIQILKTPISWSKTATINWLSLPDTSYSNKKEFMFQTQLEHNPSFHHEYYHKFTEPIRSQLNHFNFLWSQELNTKDKQLQFNGVAQLSIYFMQEQFIELDCYSKLC